MARAANVIKGVIQVLGDAAGGALRVAVGTPGSLVEYPTDVTLAAARKPRATGAAWATGGVPITALAGVGYEFDRACVAWAVIQSNATGVASVLVESSLITKVVKTEAGQYFTLTLSPGFPTGNCAFSVGSMTIPVSFYNTASTPTTFVFKLWNILAGVGGLVNDVDFTVTLVGQA